MVWNAGMTFAAGPGLLSNADLLLQVQVPKLTTPLL